MYDVIMPLVTSGASHVRRAYVVLKIVRVTLVTTPINNIKNYKLTIKALTRWGLTTRRTSWSGSWYNYNKQNTIK